MNITQQDLDNLFNGTTSTYTDPKSGIVYTVSRKSCTDNDYIKLTNRYNNNDEHVYERPKPIAEDTNTEWCEVPHIQNDM
ncbi:hypothetical protein ACR6U3_004207 [Yersinia enterocolitica]